MVLSQEHIVPYCLGQETLLSFVGHAKRRHESRRELLRRRISAGEGEDERESNIELKCPKFILQMKLSNPTNLKYIKQQPKTCTAC